MNPAVQGDLGAVTATGALYPVLAAVLPGSAFGARQWTAAAWLLATAMLPRAGHDTQVSNV